VDAHVVWRKVWFSEVQVAGSWTRTPGGARAGKLWTVTFAIAPAARTATTSAARHPEDLPGHERVRESHGLRGRSDLQSFSLYGRPGALVEQFTAIVGFARSGATATSAG